MLLQDFLDATVFAECSVKCEEGDVDRTPAKRAQVRVCRVNLDDRVALASNRAGDSLAALQADFAFGGISTQQDSDTQRRQ